jgi:uncharacterized membrane protein YfcA
VGDVLLLLLIGFVGGFAGGLLGIGGGNVYVPAMVLLLGEDQHLAQGASLAAIVATAIVGGVTHLRRGNVDIEAVVWVTPAAVIAGFGAALIADTLDAEVLQRLFAALALALSLNMIIGVLREQPVPAQEKEGHHG